MFCTACNFKYFVCQKKIVYVVEIILDRRIINVTVAKKYENKVCKSKILTLKTCQNDNIFKV